VEKRIGWILNPSTLVSIRPQEVFTSMRKQVPALRRQRGFAVITVLAFILVITVLLSGIGVFSVSGQSRALTDGDSAAAMNTAEAGVNYEFNRLAKDQNSPDQYPGVTQTLGNGTYTVWCANPDGSVPWNNTYPNHEELLVFSQGVVDGANRTVKVKVKGVHAEGDYAIYGTEQISTFNGQSVIIQGDIGTNDQLQFTGDPTIMGEIHFNGPDAGWVGSTPSSYIVITDIKAYEWPTVSQIADAMFPEGGLTWLATHNDNATAIPPILGNSITVSTTLRAGNYYLESVNLAGARAITFDNTNGPINIWIGPEGGSNIARFRGGSAAVSILSNPDYAPRIYVATRGGIDLGGNQLLEALVYAVNEDAAGDTYGHIENSGNPRVRGQLIGNDVDLNGNIQVEFVTHLIRPITFGYYALDSLWEEGQVNQSNTWETRHY
jgi:hypothetical protein